MNFASSALRSLLLYLSWVLLFWTWSISSSVADKINLSYNFRQAAVLNELRVQTKSSTVLINEQIETKNGKNEVIIYHFP